MWRWRMVFFQWSFESNSRGEWRISGFCLVIYNVIDLYVCFVSYSKLARGRLDLGPYYWHSLHFLPIISTNLPAIHSTYIFTLLLKKSRGMRHFQFQRKKRYERRPHEPIYTGFFAQTFLVQRPRSRRVSPLNEKWHGIFPRSPRYLTVSGRLIPLIGYFWTNPSYLAWESVMRTILRISIT